MMVQPINLPQRIVTADNVRSVVPQLRQNEYATARTDLGQAIVPREGTNEQIAMGPNGEMTVNTLRTTSRPVVPARSPGARVQQLNTPQTNAPQREFPMVPSPQPAPAEGRIRGIPLGSQNTFLQRLTPVREAAMQIFGDPSQPDFKGFITYAHLADDPAAQARLRPALELGLQKVRESANSYGGTLAKYVSDASGLSQAKADAHAAVLRGAVGKLSPEEMAAYDATMAMYATAVGLRSLTRASSSASSVGRIESELPIIGINTPDSASFYNKLKRLAEEISNGSRGIPNQMFNNPGEREFYATLPTFVEKHRGSNASTSKQLDAATAKKYLDKAGGDKVKARQLATADGWRF